MLAEIAEQSKGMQWHTAQTQKVTSALRILANRKLACRTSTAIIQLPVSPSLVPNLHRLTREALAHPPHLCPPTGKRAVSRCGAGVGDLFMSLIHTCEINGTNPFDYLTELLRHAAELKQHPSESMPWSYRDTLARLARPAVA